MSHLQAFACFLAFLEISWLFFLKSVSNIPWLWTEVQSIMADTFECLHFHFWFFDTSLTVVKVKMIDDSHQSVVWINMPYKDKYDCLLIYFHWSVRSLIGKLKRAYHYIKSALSGPVTCNKSIRPTLRTFIFLSPNYCI